MLPNTHSPPRGGASPVIRSQASSVLTPRPIPTEPQAPLLASGTRPRHDQHPPASQPLRLQREQPWSQNNGAVTASGFMGDTSVKKAAPECVKQWKCNATKLTLTKAMHQSSLGTWKGCEFIIVSYQVVGVCVCVCVCVCASPMLVSSCCLCRGRYILYNSLAEHILHHIIIVTLNYISLWLLAWFYNVGSPWELI